MKQSDFVYNRIYNGALNAGANRLFAQQRAVVGLELYKKNTFSGTAIKMIEAEIKEAVKLTKKAR